jgi:signal transduction histidine kinase
VTARILVLDAWVDRRRQLIEHLLIPAGYAITEAEGFTQAINLALECDLIVIYHQPLDALSFFTLLRESDSNKPIIFLTDAGSESLAVQAFRTGFSDYFSTPFDAVDFLDSVQVALMRAKERPIVEQAQEHLLQTINQFEEVDRLKTSFIANISHDLRSPLTAIMGYADLVSRAGPINEQQQLFINRITMSAQSISGLISDLLDLSRIETSSHEMGRESVSMSLIAQYALAAVEGQIKAKQHRVITHIDSKIPEMVGSGSRLKQMVRNLVQNAILYTPECGTITLSLWAENCMVVLQVKDNGIGIPVEEQSRIFDKFYRADNVRETYEGAGLGLAIVKSIVDRHDGRIWVESQLGNGSTFTVLLPTCSNNRHLAPQN